MARRYFGVRSFGAIYGGLLVAYSLGGVFGPVLFGRSFDLTGSYAPALSASVALAVISAVALLRFGPYRFEANV